MRFEGQKSLFRHPTGMRKCPRSHLHRCHRLHYRLHRLHRHLLQRCCLPWWGGSSSPPGLRALPVAMWFISLPWCDLYVIVSFVYSWIGRCYSSYIMLLPCFFIVISGDTSYHDVKVTMCALCVSLWLVSLWSVGVCWNHLVRSRW
jgi:hypothetical protein